VCGCAHAEVCEREREKRAYGGAWRCVCVRERELVEVAMCQEALECVDMRVCVHVCHVYDVYHMYHVCDICDGHVCVYDVYILCVYMMCIL